MKLLMTSSGFYTDEIKEAFFELIEDSPLNLNAVIITTASAQKENNRFAKKAHQEFKEMGFQKVQFLDVETDDASSLLDYHVLYINGGNPFHLLMNLKKSGASNILKNLAKENVVIVGVSAGAMVLGSNIQVAQFFTPEMNTTKLKKLDALKLTDKLVFPHYDREDLFRNKKSLTIEQRLLQFEQKMGQQVIRLKDDEFVLIKD
ncbi:MULTISPECIES: Type 1 glutamine amidotransferase-like domain-containing protein [Bacillus]|uniref:Type 1 glutamine amidotransferase-like domain-containing protein n=1 Tax=Bacillus TaxID=1386 RepID=UPI000BB96174|nr:MULTISPECIES: Type 1 glutamine amidotransferase-like domain-containing protein [Bacillus]